MMTLQEKLEFLKDGGPILAKVEEKGWYVFIQKRAADDGYWVSYENKFGGASVFFGREGEAFLAYSNTLNQLRSGNDCPWVSSKIPHEEDDDE